MTKKELEEENKYLKAFIKSQNPEFLYIEIEGGKRICLQEFAPYPGNKEVPIKIYRMPKEMIEYLNKS